MKNLTLVFILFATLLTVNAVPLVKRTTKFDACPVEGVPQIDVLMNPDPPVAGKTDTFDVSGKLQHDITAGTTILGIGFADQAKNPIGNPYIQPFDKSFPANTPFSIEAKDVPVPDNLPDSYYIIAIVGDPTNDPNNPIDVYGCALATVGTV